MRIKNETGNIDLQGENLFDLLKNISSQDFLDLGVHDVAYIRPIDQDGKTHYAIHAADGTPLSVMEDENSALGTIFQNDLEAVTLH